METNKIASPAKLPSGAWGARTASPTITGEVVTIRTAGGKTWEAMVSRVVSEANGMALVETAAISSRPAVVNRAVFDGETAAMAMDIMPPQTLTIRPRNVPRNWKPCGYPGCRPGLCDECDGVGYRSERGARW